MNADGTVADESERRRRMDAVAARIRVIALQDTAAEGEQLLRIVAKRSQATEEQWTEPRRLALWKVINDALSSPSADGSPWRLVVLDPAVELLGVPDENSSSAASGALRYGVHSFRRGRELTVLLLHHSRKGKVNSIEDAADSVRGSSAFIGSARWAACVHGFDAKATIRISKGNYIRKHEPITQLWSADGIPWLGPEETPSSVPTEPQPRGHAGASPATASGEGGSKPFDAGPSSSDDFFD